MSSSSAAFSLDNLSPPPSEKLCYVHCKFCDTVLAVSVPCSSLFKMVTVRCGHCSNLLSVDMRALLFPAPNQLQLTHAFLGPTYPNLLDELAACPPPGSLMEQTILSNGNVINNNHNSSHQGLNHSHISNRNSLMSTAPVKGFEDEILRNPAINRPPEKRQRVPSAYNRFIKDEIQRIKAVNPDITHREAFSAAAKNWAHFPHIHFGLMPDQGLKKVSLRQQEGEGSLLKDGFYATAAANMGVTPF